ncbi:UDP-N-acetylglucosamine acyltransferase [Pseudomonas gingeri]|uniref:UDP-N-acetylglucosamine acyltransferase n=1 Tax=Pseudomonas gingeri TaxID=117681 RepID=UPI00210E3131|nr:UDP-N-acetylglucosamine acyltransferase [Pseudomonas gingeri]
MAAFISWKSARMHARIAIGALLITLLAGCSSAPPLNFSVQDVSPSTHKLDADLRAVSVSYAAPNEQTGEVPSNGEAIPELWERAVVEAINKSSMFDDESTKKVNLFVKIQELDPPMGGATMVTDTSAKYLLVNRKTGETLLEETITNKGVVSPGYAFSGAVRAKESINRAVQNNIQEFLKRLDARR